MQGTDHALRPLPAEVAQVVEHTPEKRGVASASLALGATLSVMGWIQAMQDGQASRDIKTPV